MKLLIISFCLIVVTGCSSAQPPLSVPSPTSPAAGAQVTAGPAPTLTEGPTTARTLTPANSATTVPGETISPTQPAISLPRVTLRRGDFYFGVAGQPRLFLMRNPTGKTQADFDPVLDWAHSGGTRLLRIHLTFGWWGDPWITSSGGINPQWARNWEMLFDKAAADGIYIIPVFGVWADWNNGTPNYGGGLWQYNPLNRANRGPLTAPSDLFRSGSPAQTMWLNWVQSLVTRWHGRSNIAAWEIFSEINIAAGPLGGTNAEGGVAEPVGVDFLNRAASIIRSADPEQRPLTLSLAGTYAQTDPWADFYHLDALDFIQIHPYTLQLDRVLISDVRQKINRYNKPVLIGEAGLNAYPSAQIDKGPLAIRHAIWAGLVSGAMNARGLWFEDGYVIYNLDRTAAFQVLEKYAAAEQPAAAFVKEMDLSGFKPLDAQLSRQIFGAAIGNEKSAIGWFRDATCDPPNWDLQPVVSKQSVILTIPGQVANWRVDFYDTADGTRIISSADVVRQGSQIAIPLPDFKDDIAFKLYTQPGASVVPSTPNSTVAATTTDPIAGNWTGTISADNGAFSTALDLSIQPGCTPGRTCGAVSAPQISCSGDLVLTGIDRDMFVFVERNMVGAPGCVSGGYEYLQLQPDGTLSYRFNLTDPSGASSASHGILKRRQ